ncbi:NAD-dependent succinate-semialdehyde dehydrogenase [Iodidimonas muriae]|uniref:NAD-dependent succinate-semialdehyde dehydrogenase n=1 Tax=Iodidimonas muriae TaxID=261467 RepID=A0ABQ2LC80_9PROT|nr:NAD-dependent succinate-semialdehyde dehydrogenase [Iodidimonas muriae]GER06767.1 NAD-dependent succinate-semialdehyde dehydrogenase [Kordiimonadales bacterium JCM 17843]GGO10061.1 NAD-dependent succinate-semialdehyde dehydrogenase [Iodidimonas muriae]
MAEPIISVDTGLYIDGQWRPASDGADIAVKDPATEETIARVSCASKEDAIDAVEAAHRAQASWAVRPPRERSEILRKAFELMTARAEGFARLIAQENGKALKDARGEVAYAAEFFRWYAEEAVRNLSDLSMAPSGKNRIMVLHQPVGVALLITPWNFPAAMATRKIGPALAAGCSVILKPASETPLTALAIARLLEEAGVPKGVVNVIASSRSSKIVPAILDDPRIGKLSFTGSTQVGRILLGNAAKTVINCSMELGGNAPVIVFNDADLDTAVEGAMIAKMRNGGEACTAANRFYVEDGIADAFTKRFSEAMASLKIGPGLQEDTDLGPLINQAARDDMEALVEDAVSTGGHIATGGIRPNGRGFFYQPTVLTDSGPNARVLHEEIFGPIAPIQRFDDVDDMITRANDTEYGLISYVFTENLKKGLMVSERLHSGMVGLNRGVVSDPAAPFGGVKQSGLGREGAHDGMMEFLEKKYIAVDW